MSIILSSRNTYLPNPIDYTIIIDIQTNKIIATMKGHAMFDIVPDGSLHWPFFSIHSRHYNITKIADSIWDSILEDEDAIPNDVYLIEKIIDTGFLAVALKLKIVRLEPPNQIAEVINFLVKYLTEKIRLLMDDICYAIKNQRQHDSWKKIKLDDEKLIDTIFERKIKDHLTKMLI